MPTLTLNASSLKPLGDRVFIKIAASDEKTSGGIYLPDAAKEKPQVGEIVSVGPGKRKTLASWSLLKSRWATKFSTPSTPEPK